MASSFYMTRIFHEAMGLPVHDKPREPTVEERILRAKLLFEETMETIEKGLGIRVSTNIPRDDHYTDLCITMNPQFRVDGPYDPVETLDGLADVKVIANGTAVQFGLPMEAADREVFNSNMSKLDDTGRPIVNECIIGLEDADHDCEADADVCVFRDPSQPAGKRLKGPNFRKPDIAGLIEAAKQGLV